MGSVSSARARIAGDQPFASGIFGIKRFFTLGKTLTDTRFAAGRRR